MARTGWMRPADQLMAPAVAETVSRLTLDPADAALAALAEQYARTVDDAALIAAEVAELTAEDEDTASRIARLERRVEAHAVLNDLGPKLLAALEALGASPRARAAIAKGKTPAAPTGKLAALRGGRAG